jgi:exopolyphosphatase/guanosine-5'-triphosphate,3'-diphosphate pyrophosphatase
MLKGALRDGEDAAVIDVGSNSVRLVIYRIDGRAMTPVLNEKVMAGLGRDLPRTGALAPAGVESALRALKRFATLIEAQGVARVFPVATAAVRDASDGSAFANRVKAEVGIDLRILTGQEEAHLSALGVRAGVAEADGIVGDLGGASLELIRIAPNAADQGETFSLGPFTLASEDGFDYSRVQERVAAELSRSNVLSGAGGAFFAVGGAWRALGRIDIALTQHPLGVLHFHEMTRAQVLKVAELVRKQSKRSLEKLEEAAAKRADTLPYAAVVLEQVMLAGGFERVILSAFGLREGVLLEQMSETTLRADPLVAAAEALAGRTAKTRAFGRALEQWIAPMFAERAFVFPERRELTLRGAASRLADVGGPLHPDQRIEIMYDLILRAPLAAISHSERAFLAAAIHHRYTKAQPRHAEAYLRLLSEEQQAAAAALGAALRLGAELSGRSEGLLGAFDIRVEKGRLRLRAARKVAHLFTEAGQRRLDAAAGALGLTAEMTIT